MMGVVGEESIMEGWHDDTSIQLPVINHCRNGMVPPFGKSCNLQNTAETENAYCSRTMKNCQASRLPQSFQHKKTITMRRVDW